MSRTLVRRLVETFFRHPFLYLLPLILMVATGAWTVANLTPNYRSGGTLYVESETFLASLTTPSGANVGWDTPAGYFTQQLTSLIETDVFAVRLAESAGIQPAGPLFDTEQLDEIRDSLSVTPTGINLVRVIAEHPDPGVAYALAEATIDNYVQWNVETEVRASAAAEEFFRTVVQEYADQVTEARADLDRFLANNPEPPEGSTARPFAETIVLERFTAGVGAAEERLELALANEEAARLASVQAEADSRQKFQILDHPIQPTAAESALRDTALRMGAFSLIGVALTGGFLVVMTAIDRTVLSESDLAARLDAPIAAVIPEAVP